MIGYTARQIAREAQRHDPREIDQDAIAEARRELYAKGGACYPFTPANIAQAVELQMADLGTLSEALELGDLRGAGAALDSLVRRYWLAEADRLAEIIAG